jgi:hypothetical protein
VTLIAAFRCDEGVALCADSQETVDDDFWVKVDKLKPNDAGAYQIAIGGSGNYVELIEGFTAMLPREAKKWPAGLDDDGMAEKIREVLLDFYANEVEKHPEKDAEKKTIDFIACLRDKTNGQVFLYRTSATGIWPILTYDLIGALPFLYQNEVRKLYNPKLTLARLRLLGVHVLSVAKRMTKWIGSDTTILFVTHDGMEIDEYYDSKTLEGRLEVFSQSLASLELALPDNTITDEAFAKQLAWFESQVLRLRDGYIRQDLGQAVGRVICDPHYRSEPISSFPSDTMMRKAKEGERDVAEVKFTLTNVEDLVEEVEERLLKKHGAEADPKGDGPNMD